VTNISWFGKKQAAEYLGVCKSTIDNLESKGLLKGYRVYLGGRRPILRFKKEDLDRLFERQKGRPRQKSILR
jgi:excisionase family DNA binding protein